MGAEPELDGADRMPDDAAKVLDIAVKAGANESGGIDWSLKDENAPQAQAAGQGAASGRGSGDRDGAGLGVKLGALIFASNETPGRETAAAR